MFAFLTDYKNTRRIVALVLLCAMLLSGCGEAAPIQESEPSAEPAVTAEPSPEPSPEPVKEPYRTDVVLSELQASNKACVPDEDGEFSDWIELYNPGGEPCDISGCWLSDSEKELCRWQIPEMTIESGGCRVIFCSKKDRREGELHTNFKLSSAGDTLYFSSPDGELLWEKSYESCGADCSLCFDGESDPISTYYPTPGYPNTEAGYEDYIVQSDRHGALVINEAVTYNDDALFHAAGYYDWVELKNVSDEAIQLGDYYVTDDSDEPQRFQLPNETLKPGATYVVFCGEAQMSTASCHAPFKLNSSGDNFFVYHADGTLSDYVSLYGVPLNYSKGRIDGKSGFFLFQRRTPAAPNGYGLRRAAARPESVTRTGIYNDVSGVDVVLSGEGTIYYTLNGNIPNEDSFIYDEPIHLTQSTVVRAISVCGGKLTSETATFTYIINEFHELPVVCVALEPMKLDVLYNHNGKMEYDSHAEYYDGEDGFASDCMITLHGAASRTVWEKKSFKIVFRNRYGGDISYDLFGQGITDFHSLNLRGGDSVGLHTFREPMSAEFADRVAVQDPMALDSRFCILYVNAKYYGIYVLREAYSQKYVESHTGSDEDLSTISRAPIQIQYQPELYQLHNFICSCDMNDPANYDYIADRMDMESMAQWLLLETYFNNLDPTGNVRYSRGNRPDGKWRLMFFDLDISMTNTHASIYPMIETGSQIGRMLTNLLRAPQFRQTLLETAAGMYQNGLSYTLALEIFDRMVEEVESEMNRNLGRWGENRQLYDNAVAWQRLMFTQERDDSWLEIVQIYTGADGATMAAYFPERG